MQNKREKKLVKLMMCQNRLEMNGKTKEDEEWLVKLAKKELKKKKKKSWL